MFFKGFSLDIRLKMVLGMFFQSLIVFIGFSWLTLFFITIPQSHSASGDGSLWSWLSHLNYVTLRWGTIAKEALGATCWVQLKQEPWKPSGQLVGGSWLLSLVVLFIPLVSIPFKISSPFTTLTTFISISKTWYLSYLLWNHFSASPPLPFPESAPKYFVGL